MSQACVFADSKPLELKWEELSPMVDGHRVELTLRDGIKIRGDAITTRGDALVVDVKKSTDKERHPLGSTAAPRDAIVLIKVERIRGTWGRTLGTTVGVITGLGIGGYAGAHTDSGGAAVATVVAVTSGVAVLGYFAGRSLDRRVTRIIIVP